MNTIHSPQRRSGGFGLIELMIAMVLGLIVLGAAIAVFQSNTRSFRSNEGLNRVQEGARAGYEMMSRDLRSAGTSACTNEGMVLGADANSMAFRAPLTGTASQVTTRSADDQSYRVSTGSVSSVTLVPVTGFTPSDAFRAGDVIMVCNGSMVGFTTVGSVSGQVVTFGAPLDFDPANTERAAPGSISIARFRNTVWQVNSGALVVSRNGGANQQVATGVQNLAISYHQFAGGNPNAYVAAPTDFNYVDAARFSFQVREAAPMEVGGSPAWITRDASTKVGVRSRIP